MQARLYLCNKKRMERVRFAPSPTGPLHIGGLRTALFNYLYARKHEGVFILRIEDTDQNRKVEGSEDYILESLKWCGIEADESPVNEGNFGPYRQSERKDIYKEYIQLLLANSKAYYAFDTTEELAAAREKSERETGGFKYNHANRHTFRNSLTMDTSEVEALKEAGEYVIRLKVDADQGVLTQDLVRGTVRVNTNELEDKILVKKDGMPTYHFANVVDDYLMKITTVIRGEEWLPSLPIHQLLYDAFGWEAPKFMHLPLILNPSGKGKLSKRDGDKNGYPVFPLQWNESSGYREQGFLPEAHLNYIAQLGWSLEDGKEIQSLKEMEQNFSVDRVQKGGARFDFEKAKWVNKEHLNKFTSAELTDRSDDLFSKHRGVLRDNLNAAVELIKDRLELLTDVEKEMAVFVHDPVDYDEKSMKRISKFDVQSIAVELRGLLNDGVEDLKERIGTKAKELDLGMGAFLQTLRVAVVGGLSGPDLIPLVEVIGKDVTLRRLERLINR